MTKNRAHIFDGKRFAREKEIELEEKVASLRKKDISPKLASIVIGDIEGGKFYQNLKKKAAERVGGRIEIKNFDEKIKLAELIESIKNLNEDRSVHGIMVQLPLPKNLRHKTQDIIKAIAPEKDVDGMRDDSPYLAPVVKAILFALKEATNNILRQPLKVAPYKVVVVGAKGFVGRKTVRVLEEMGYEVGGVDLEVSDLGRVTRKTDILITAVGKSSLIKESMVKKGVVVIDVGALKGDVDFDKVSKKASFVTPVPGGIGPVTISYLLENLVEAARIER